MPTPTLLYSDLCLSHQTAGHPESPERLKSILSLLDSEHLLSHLHQYEPRPISQALLQKVHTPQYIKYIRNFCQSAGNGKRIEENTVVSLGSYPAALVAAGGAINVIERLVGDREPVVFSLLRPPGHHAISNDVMGFCLFNNIALAARYAQDTHGFKRILILDWDAHHGNGTEDIFYQDPQVLFISIHQYPNWPPGTGSIEDIGAGKGKGYNINIPLLVRYGQTAYIRVFKEIIEPAVERFQPELILVSAGYDAHHADPLTDMGLTANSFGQFTELVMKMAERWCGSKVGLFLEGGYHLEGLAYSVLSTILTLVKEDTVHIQEPMPAIAPVAEMELDNIIARVKAIQPLLNAVGVDPSVDPYPYLD